MKRFVALMIATAFLLASGMVWAQNWRREPTFGATTLQSGFVPDPAAYPLTAGGGADPVNVAQLGLVDGVTRTPCSQSFITRSPDFRFHFQEGSSFNFMRFYVQTHNGADATLLVNMPDTTWRCNDDSFGTLMPSIDLHNPPSGQYDIWVGTYDASSHNPTTFYITELDSNRPGGGAVAAPTPTPQIPPTPPVQPGGQFGPGGLNTGSFAGSFPPVAVAAGFMPDPMVVTGTSGGGINMSSSGIASVNGGTCTGYVNSNPNHVLTFNSPFSYVRVDAVGMANGDTTMIIQDPHGNYWCDDDGGGYPNPRVAGAFQPGTHRVWIGSYGAGQYHQYNLSVTEYTP